MPKQRHQSPSSQTNKSSSPQHSIATSKTVSPSNSSSPTNAKNRINEIQKRNTRAEDAELALRRKLVPRLAKRAYHLEDDNTWCQDWVQYQRNTHPVFGLCCYHYLHPIRVPQRVIILVGSIAFGFAMTNIVYLGYLNNAPTSVNYVYDATGKLTSFSQKYTSVELKQSMVFLLTVGSFLHSTFDMCIWYLMACFCFRPGGACYKPKGSGGGGRVRGFCQNFGIYVAVGLVMVVIVAATSVAVVRLNEDQQTAENDALVEDDQQQQQQSSTMAEKFAENQVLDKKDDSADKFTFLLGYAMELVVAFFVFYPLTSTVFFSGVLGCGRLPVLGGRPYEIWKAGLLRGNRNGSTNDGEVDEDDYEGVEGMRAYV